LALGPWFTCADDRIAQHRAPWPFRSEAPPHWPLHLDLVQAAGRVARLHVDDAELVVQKLPLVVGVEKVSIGLGTQKCLEDAVDLGVDGVAHAQSIAQPAIG